MSTNHEADFKCVSIHARSIVNKINKLNITIENIDPHLIGIAESWANKDIGTDSTGIFRRDRIGRNGRVYVIY